MIVLKDISFGYGKKSAGREPFLSIGTLEIPERRVTALIGPNGSGKSTLLKIFSGILRPFSGEIIVGGRDIGSIPQKERAREIAFVAQSRTAPSMRVKDFVLHGRFPHRGSIFPRGYTKTDEKKADDALAMMGIAHLAERNAQELSGGQFQNACIALALAQETPVLALDEPFSFLDVRQQLELARLLGSLGKTVVLVIHDLALALALAEHLVVLSSGKVAAHGTADDIIASKAIERVFGVRLERKSAVTFSLGG